MARSILILGSTGSIGTQALELIDRSDDLTVAGLSADRSWEPLVEHTPDQRHYELLRHDEPDD